MGIRLVQGALSPVWLHLTERARLALAHMALVAHDTGTPNSRRACWWEGLDVLMLKVLGLTPHELTNAEYKTAYRKIQRVIKELKDAGAIEVIEPGRRGHNAVYRLHPDGPLEAVDNSAVDHANGHESTTPSTVLSGASMTCYPPDSTSPAHPIARHPAPSLGEQEENSNYREQEKRSTQVSA